jgi:hypothetical protein
LSENERGYMDKITFYKNVKRKKIAEVNFPIYIKYNVSGDNYDAIYYLKRINQKLTYSICKSFRYHSGTTTYELEICENDWTNDSNNGNYLFGKGCHKLSEKEWNEIHNEFLENLNKVKTLINVKT